MLYKKIKQLVRLLPVVILVQLLMPVSVPNAFASYDLNETNQKTGVAVIVSQYETSQQPGGMIKVYLGIYNTDFADKKGLSSADITISYDEKVFEAPDELFENNEEFKSSNPQPLDLDPKDGRKELRFTMTATGNQYYKTETRVDKYAPEILGFYLEVKEDAPLKKTAITVATKNTVLRNSSNAVVDSFYFRSAHLNIEKPQSISITQGYWGLPTQSPFTFHVGDSASLFGRAYFSNGEDYDLVSGTFSSSDTSVVTLDYNTLRAVGLGSARVRFSSGDLTTEKRIDVVEDSIVIPPIQEYAYGGVYKDPYIDDQQLFLNGEDIGLGRIIDGSIYAPLKKIATVIGAKVSYDSAKRVPSLNGIAVTNFKVIGVTTYFKLADMREFVGAVFSWDKNNKILFITAKMES